MKFWITMIVGIVVITALSTALYIGNPDLQQRPNLQTAEAPVDQGPRPKAVVPENKRTLENLPQLYHGTVRFEIRNDGEAELRLNDTKQPSCSCATTSLEKSVLAPGEKTDYVIDFNTKDKTGPFAVTAGVMTNDPKTPRLEFAVQMIIYPDIMVQPTTLEFGLVTEGKRTERPVFVFSTIRDDVKVNEVAISNKAFKSELEPLTPEELASLKAKSGVKAKLIIDDFLPVGPFTERIQFRTNNEKFPARSIDATGTVEGKLQAAPKDIDFGATTGSTAQEDVVQIFGRGLQDGEELKLGEVTPSFLKVELVKDPNYKAWKLIARLPSDAPAGAYTGSVAIVDQKGIKRLILPVKATVGESIPVGSASR